MSTCHGINIHYHINTLLYICICIYSSKIKNYGALDTKAKPSVKFRCYVHNKYFFGLHSLLNSVQTQSLLSSIFLYYSVSILRFKTIKCIDQTLSVSRFLFLEAST